VANEFFLHDSGGIGPSLKYQGNAFTAGQFGAWTPVGVEKTASGWSCLEVWQRRPVQRLEHRQQQQLYQQCDGTGLGFQYAFQSLETTFSRISMVTATGLKTTPIETSGATSDR
jgi:serralysin